MIASGTQGTVRVWRALYLGCVRWRAGDGTDNLSLVTSRLRRTSAGQASAMRRRVGACSKADQDQGSRARSTGTHPQGFLAVRPLGRAKAWAIFHFLPVRSGVRCDVKAVRVSFRFCIRPNLFYNIGSSLERDEAVKILVDSLLYPGAAEPSMG